MIMGETPKLVNLVPRFNQLQTRAIILVVSIMAISAGLSNWILAWLIQDKLSQVLARDTITISDLLIEDIRPRLIAGQEQLLFANDYEPLDNQRLAFVLVEDINNRAIDTIINDLEIWYAYTGKVKKDLFFSRTSFSQPTSLDYPEAPEALVYRAPIFSKTNDNKSVDEDNILLGFVLIGIVDPVHRATMQNVEATTMTVVCVVCLLSIPLTIIIVRYLTRPLRRITRATALLAEGKQPPPLGIARKDEIGVLARSFHEMATKLTNTRQELENANENLESLVEQRTKQIKQVNDLLQREIKTKNEFLRTVSHDLTAPLRNIAGMVRMIQRKYEEELPEEVTSRMERIRANIDVEATMLDDLLTLSRLRTKPGKPENVDLAELVHTVVGTLSNDIDENKIEIQISNDWPVVFLEPNLARQVLQNLIDNAVKYMGDSTTRRITISGVLNEEYNVYQIRIADTGPGIQENELDQIFQVFRRGSSANKSEVPGRGIGLPSVKMVAERWGGSLELESEYGKGSTFILTIPAGRIVHTEEACCIADVSQNLTTDVAA